MTTAILLLEFALIFLLSFTDGSRSGDQENRKAIEDNAVLLNEIESLKSRVQDLETYKAESYILIRNLQADCGMTEGSTLTSVSEVMSQGITKTATQDTTSQTVPPKDPPIVPLFAKVETRDNENTFVLEYISDTEPKVNWSMLYFYSNLDDMNPFPEFNSSYNGSHGITSVTTNHQQMTVYLSHPSLLWFVEVSLTAENPTPHKQVIFPVKITVQPYDDAIIFKKGQIANATLSVRSSEEMFWSRSIRTSFVTLKRRINTNASRGVVYIFEDSTYVTTENGRPPLLVGKKKTYLYNQKVTYQINPDKTNNEGILFISVIYVTDHPSLVTEMMITRLMPVRQSDHKAAFKRGYVNFVTDQSGTSDVYCHSGRTCFVLCSAIGNRVLNITLWRNNQQIDVLSLETELRYIFMKTFFLRHVTGHDGGIYVCKAETDVGTIANQPINVVVTFAGSETDPSQSNADF